MIRTTEDIARYRRTTWALACSVWLAIFVLAGLALAYLFLTGQG